MVDRASRSWKTRFGFYLLALGSAFGLGNLWRFPYVVGENGGGVFVILYILLCLLVGLPLVVGELILGRSTGSSMVMAVRKLAEKQNGFLLLKFCKSWGWFSVLLSLVVLSYYCVISGWVLHYLIRFLIIPFLETGDALSPQALLQNGLLQFLLSSVHILIVMILMAKGIHEGLEKGISFVMPVFAVLVLVLVARSMSLPSSGEVLRFLFYPDFSKLTFSTLNHALGHVFFTLSVGFGTMVTFGSYLKKEEHIPTAAYRVTLVDGLVSLVALLLIFPLAFQASNRAISDPALLFEFIPKFLNTLPGGPLFGVLFFVCLYGASLNATFGMFESLVANLREVNQKRSRSSATALAGVLVLSLSIAPAFFSLNFINHDFFSWFAGRSLIEVVDSFLIHWLLPCAVLGLVLVLSRLLTAEQKKTHFLESNKLVSVAMYPYWLFALKYFVPGILVLGLGLQLIGLAIS